jgi:hypothetical protein
MPGDDMFLATQDAVIALVSCIQTLSSRVCDFLYPVISLCLLLLLVSTTLTLSNVAVCALEQGIRPQPDRD